MKHRFALAILAYALSTQGNTANLMEVYQEATLSDPIYQQNIAKMMASQEGFYISLASLLPAINGTGSPYLSSTRASGPGARFIGSFDTRGYGVKLNATQTVFNFAQIKNVTQAKAIAKQAGANLNAAAQDLMLRVAKAYFKVLEDVDVLRAAESTKLAFAKQLDQITAQYDVGIKTITDVYTAQASYESSVSDYIAALNTLENDRENLRAITGKMYPSLATLSETFPLVTPQPNHIDQWVDTAIKQNWLVKGAQYGVTAAKENIQQQFAGHLPSLNVQGTYNIDFSHDIGDTSSDIINPPGAGKIYTSTIALNLTVPIAQGGLVLAQTRQAKDNYQLACQTLEQQLRSAVNLTRQSYLNVVAGIQKIAADKKAITSAKSSLAGMEEGYRVGTEILLNVLNQQQQVFINERIYARDRYDYINNLLTLKQVAGTLCPEDLAAINAWLQHEVNLNKEFPEKVREMIDNGTVTHKTKVAKKKIHQD